MVGRSYVDTSMGEHSLFEKGRRSTTTRMISNQHRATYLALPRRRQRSHIRLHQPGLRPPTDAIQPGQPRDFLVAIQPRGHLRHPRRAVEQDVFRRHRAAHLVGLDQGVGLVYYRNREHLVGGRDRDYLGAVHAVCEDLAAGAGGRVLAEGGTDSV